MAAPARYNFDLDLDAPPPAPPVVLVPVEPEVPRIDLVDHLLQLSETDKRARAEGYEAGRDAAEVRAVERLADEVARLNNACRSLVAAQDAIRTEVERDAIELARVFARKLATGLIEREPLAEIQALIRTCLGPLRRAPHLVLRLAADDAEAIRPQMDRMVRESGFEGRVVILGEPELARGDCRIEWADGGIIRDRATTERDIDRAIARYLGTDGIGAADA